jgi:hypothetical protein
MYTVSLIGWVLDNYIDIGSGKLCQHHELGAEKTRARTFFNPNETQNIEFADVNTAISKLNKLYPQSWTEYSRDIEYNYLNKVKHNLNLAQYACVRHIVGEEVVLPSLLHILKDIVNGTEASCSEAQRALAAPVG